MTNQTVAFVGLGYIGLPTAVVMANSGIDVTGVDINAENVSRINRGEVTIIEPGLEEELMRALESGKFRATTKQVHADTYISQSRRHSQKSISIYNISTRLQKISAPPRRVS